MPESVRESGPGSAPVPFATGFSWPEAPRWHDGALWISDVHNFRVARVTPDGRVETALDVPERPAGMDFRADGRLVLGTSLKPLLLSFDGAMSDRRVEADLDAGSPDALDGPLIGNFNDLVSAQDGWSWIGDTGFTFGVDEPVRRGRLFAHHAEHGTRRVADGLFFPNGITLSPDGETLYLSETFGQCITAFDIRGKGELGPARRHVDLPGHPDGLCLDEKGHLWVPLLMEERFVRVDTSGRIVETIETPGHRAIACTIGGEDGTTLFLCGATVTEGPDGPVREGTVTTRAVDSRGVSP